jgi:hypothetical protein
MVLLLSIPGAQVFAQVIPAAAAGSQLHSQDSWGLGVVVPQGSALGPGALSWGRAANLTVWTTLPGITNTTATTYAILSLMTSDGTVFQTGAGINPGEREWLDYSMYIDDVSAQPQAYHWALNGSGPASLPGDTVSLSLYLSSSGGWMYKVTNLRSGSVCAGSFGSPDRSPPKAADQEVFALESYSWNTYVFESMGNMTLKGVWIDGTLATGTWYSYGDWDLTHSLAFVVGGSPLPLFVGIALGEGTATWYYSAGPESVTGAVGKGAILMAAAIVIGLSAGAVVAGGAAGLRRGRGGRNEIE